MRLGKITDYNQTDKGVHFFFEKGKVEITPVTSRIIHIYYDEEGKQYESEAVEWPSVDKVDYSVEKVDKTVGSADNSVEIHTKELKIRIEDDFYVDIYNSRGDELCLDYRGEKKPAAELTLSEKKLLEEEGHWGGGQESYAFHIVKKIQGQEAFYGLGDKTGYLNKRGYEYEMWNTDNPAPQVDCFKALYKSIPFLIVKDTNKVYGVFLDNSFKSYFDLGKESQLYYSFGAKAGSISYFFIGGNSIAEVVKNYCLLTGTPPLPQKWTLGYHQSRWGYITSEDMEELATKFREKKIPCDALHFDIDYMEDYKVFTWREENYQGDAKSYLKSLSQRGFKSVVIIDPGVKKEEGYKIYDQGVERGYFAKDSEGEIYTNKVWPGDSVYPDFGNPKVRKWWASNHEFLLAKGVRGIWNDMNEPASFEGPLPFNVKFSYNGREMMHEEIHNLYGHLMAKATFEGLKELDKRRPFVITRACFASSQKYATAWTGDNHSMWAHLQMAIPQLCNLGLSGMPFVGTDVGGFGSDTTKELLIRWVQLGCFSPLFRNHSALGTRRQEPWQFDQETEEIYRSYVKLRYRLIPYYYDLCFAMEQTGEPIMRPLCYYDEEDESAKNCNDEFMIGEHILVAPVVYQGMTKRMVYLPKGEWYDYRTKEKYQGNSWIIADSPLSVCPIYIKAGTILPVGEDVQYIGQEKGEVLTLEVYPGEGEYHHYLDQGEDYSYREGKYHHYHFIQTKTGEVKTKLLKEGYHKPYKEIVIKRQGDTE